MRPWNDDLGADPDYCDGLSESSCPVCGLMVSTSDIVQLLDGRQLCEECDARLMAEAMEARFPEMAGERK